MKNGGVCRVAEKCLKIKLTTLCHLCKIDYVLSMVYQCLYIYIYAYFCRSIT
jgi:hypothetical protein